MDRVTVYPAEIPLTEDVLDGQRNAYIAVGHLAQLALGSRTAASGFSVSSSGLQLSVNPGAVYAAGEVDASAYGELAADTSPLVQQFISPGITHLTAPASSTSYIYATTSVLDADPLVLPFYNAVNPSQTFSGQNNSGSALPTRRRNVATVAIGATIPPGAIPLWKVVATASAVTVTAAPGAPFYTTLAQASLRICAPFDPVLAAAAGGYPKGVVLPDSTTPGVFWVSTADANTTVPGATGAKWKSLFDGLATQTWADNRYMPLGGNVTTTGQYTTTQWIATSITTQTVSGVINNWGGYLTSKLEGRDVTANFYTWEKEGQDQGATIEIAGYGLDVSYRFPKNGRISSPAGSMAVLSDLAPYALTSALSEETTRAKSAETTLQTNITNEASARASADTSLSNAISAETSRAVAQEALKANLSGGNSLSGLQTVTGAVTLVNANPATSSGSLNVSPYFTTGSAGRGTVSLWNREVVNASNQAAITVMYNGTEQTRFYVNNDGSLSTTQNGNVAFTSDLPLPIGMHVQIFAVTIPAGTKCGFGDSPFVASLPSAFTTFSYAHGTDVGAGVFTVAANPASPSSVNIFAQSPQSTSGPSASGSLIVLIFAYGYP